MVSLLALFFYFTGGMWIQWESYMAPSIMAWFFFFFCQLQFFLDFLRIKLEEICIPCCIRKLYNSVLILTRLAQHQGDLDDVYCNVTILKITQYVLLNTLRACFFCKIFVLPHKKPVSNELCRILEFTVYRNQVEKFNYWGCSWF